MNPSALKWACTSFGTCVGSVLAYAIPILQVALLAVSLYAAIKSLRKK